jgi:hypothetical protein
MQLSLSEALLVSVFRAARVGRRANLTAFCARYRIGVPALEGAFAHLDQGGLLSFERGHEQLTLAGLALAAALSKGHRSAQRPLAACRPLAA